MSISLLRDSELQNSLTRSGAQSAIGFIVPRLVFGLGFVWEIEIIDTIVICYILFFIKYRSYRNTNNTHNPKI